MVGIMRASATYDLLASWRSQTRDLQNQLNTTSLEVATGLKADVYKSLGFGSSEVLSLRMQLDRNDEFIASNQILANKLDVTALTLKNVRDISQEFLNTAAFNTSYPSESAKGMQAAAGLAIEQITGLLNTSFQSASLFSGIQSDKAPLQKWDETNPATGFSPADVLANVVGPGLTSATDAAQKAAAIENIFASNDTVQPDRNFEATFYNGAPRLQTGGGATPRLQSQIDKNTNLSYGIQANDPEITAVLRGLSMIAATDVTEIGDNAAYQTWMDSAFSALSAGVTGLIGVEAKLGSEQKMLENKVTAQQTLGDIFTSRVSKLEGVDLLDASSRIIQLQTQLQATYTVTSRLSKLSFLNFM